MLPFVCHLLRVLEACIYLCLRLARMSMHHGYTWCDGGQKGVLELQELELQELVSLHVLPGLPSSHVFLTAAPALQPVSFLSFACVQISLPSVGFSPFILLAFSLSTQAALELAVYLGSSRL